ncbi:ADP-ribosylglycohydrolase family protein [Virgisporangium ochraceum]|uniref:Hydrolase n=1 Tax=Virgisporangium ochraceum TaxID=65505 RepID=A0A8J4E8V9_9ACTN|nr:ADP-ribosylglycohydrolase family protein [Virgisporangium ochraceum]GIJ65784.1 hydrolase [Virgisporangium ochraceum]
MSPTLYERARLDLCYDSLTGLSVGDALGAQFFMVGRSLADLRAGIPPPPVWDWTDDTEMACTLAAELRDHGTVDSPADQDRLAYDFADRCEPYRGYGAGAVVCLHAIRDGMPWREAAGRLFGGEGSCGNGAAMRVAPLGAYFAGDPVRAAAQATASAEVTHTHPEGIAGAVVVAVAAAQAASARISGIRPTGASFLEKLRAYAGEGQLARGMDRAERLLGRSGLPSVEEAAYELGNGSRVTAQDTVPFAMWVAGTYLHDYPAAITACVEAGGDVDTTAAIVGGVVAAFTSVGGRPEVNGVPPTWVDAREPLPGWCERS